MVIQRNNKLNIWRKIHLRRERYLERPGICLIQLSCIMKSLMKRKLHFNNNYNEQKRTGFKDKNHLEEDQIKRNKDHRWDQKISPQYHLVLIKISQYPKPRSLTTMTSTESVEKPPKECYLTKINKSKCKLKYSIKLP